jgi:hypothetical protein
MKYKNALNLLAGLLFATVALSAPQAAQAGQCSLAGVAGKWGFTTSGTVVGIGPRASLGIFTLDGSGNLIRGKATASLNGSVTDETFSGTYTVNPDCTSKLAIDIFNLAGNKILTATIDLVFDDNVREARGLFTSAVLPNGAPLATVITVDGKRIFTAEEND